MPINPEQMQEINNLQQRMLRNIQQGLRSWEGLTEEEITNALSFFRQNRAAAGALGGKAKAEKKKKVKVNVEVASLSPEKVKKFAALLDEE